MAGNPAPADDSADGDGGLATPAAPAPNVHTILDALVEVYGPRPWPGGCDPVAELIGTILSQHTSDVNTERAFASLRGRFASWSDVITASPAEVAESIRSGGLANVKAPRIQAVLREIETRNGGFDLSALATLSVADARAELMSYPGVGPKTASCVLLFALGKAAMPVDTHVHRVAKRLGLIPPTASAEKAHALLECQLGDDRDSAYAFHMHVIRHGRTTCLARRPACDRCCLSTWCNDFNSRHP